MKILIQNGHVIDPANKIDRETDLYIEDGIIKEIGDRLRVRADNVIQARGKWVVPGLIDLHVHFREPGYEHKETIRTGTLSAAKGGFTTVCCMPNTNPVIDSKVYLDNLKQIISRDAAVNVLPIGSITKGQKGIELSEIEEMAEAGICALSEDGYTVSNAELLKEAMRMAARAGIPVFSHCEDISLVNGGCINEGETADRMGLKGISADSEEVIAARDIILAKASGVHLHLCHLSTAGSIELLREARLKGGQVSAEVTPHHFTLSDEDITADDGNYKMNPPLRSKKDRDVIVEGLRDGTVTVIATDHAPHHQDEKTGGFEKAANGIVGLETALPLAITELVDKGILTPSGLVEKMSLNPAVILGIPKGRLGLGQAADISIIDPKAEYEIDVAVFESKGKNSPFHGRSVRGRVDYTIVNGKIVYASCF